ncbi:MAG: MmgE/PrpD family protein [Acetobacterales bacterium]
MSATDRLAAFVAGLDLAALSPATVERCKIHLLDTIGVAIRGSTTVHGRQAAALVDELGGRSEATVIGATGATNALNAAFANGVMAHAIDFDDGHKFVHPGCAVVSAALAAAESEGVDGAALLVAVVAGYEVSIRVSLAAGLEHRERGFHPTSTCNVFGAAAAGARLMGADAATLSSALGIALAESGGTCQYRFDGSPNKHLHGGVAARGGLQAARLARGGFRGTAEPIEGTFGVARAMSDGGEPEALTDELGDGFLIDACYIKPYPSCRRTHEPLDLVVDGVRKHGVDAGAIRSVVLDTYAYAYQPWLVSTEPPRTSLEAMLNTPYCLAAAFRDGLLSLDQFDDAHLADPEIAALARRITVRSDEELTRKWPASRGARLHVTLGDGRTVSLETDNPRGGPEKPFGWEDVCGKFAGLAEPVIGRDAARLTMDVVADLEKLDDAGALMRPLAAAGRASAAA